MDSPDLKTKVAAAYIGLEPTTLERWRWQGKGPRYLKVGGAVRYPKAFLDEFKAECERTSTSDRGPAKTTRSTR